MGCRSSTMRFVTDELNAALQGMGYGGLSLPYYAVLTDELDAALQEMGYGFSKPDDVN